MSLLEHPRVEHIAPSTLRSSPRNPRTHSPQQIKKIAASIRKFGFVNPILIDENNRILSGHGRVEAARQLSLSTVPALRYSHLSEAEKNAYVIADNRLGELAGWDRDLLRLELGELIIHAPDLDLTLTGFEIGEIDRIVFDDAESPTDDTQAENVPEIADGPPVTRPGDLWLIGEHRIFCGDARQLSPYRALLTNGKAGMVFTDPPYNVAIQGHARGLGRQRFSEFAMASGEMSQREYERFMRCWINRAAQFSRGGCLHFIFSDWRHIRDVLNVGGDLYDQLLNICVWDKQVGGMGSLYRSQHELIAVFRAGRGQHQNNVQLGKFARNRTNVWSCPGANSFGPERRDLLQLHPTVKPVRLAIGAILDASRPGDVVLDPFGGSGSTLVACQATKRKGCAIEIDPKYVDVIIERLRRYANLHAVHAQSKRTFDEEALLRRTGQRSEAKARSRSGDAR
jgi:DNA modification methylase